MLLLRCGVARAGVAVLRRWLLRRPGRGGRAAAVAPVPATADERRDGEGGGARGEAGARAARQPCPGIHPPRVTGIVVNHLPLAGLLLLRVQFCENFDCFTILNCRQTVLLVTCSFTWRCVATFNTKNFEVRWSGSAALWIWIAQRDN